MDFGFYNCEIPFGLFWALQKFKLPPSASRWKRKLYYFLRNRLKFPGEFFNLSLASFVISKKLFIEMC